MIAHFPEPYPDELFHSLCARFSDRMQFGTETGTMLALYGSRHAIATVDLPHRLGALASQLSAGHPCTADVMIDHHTFLPYYAPFLTTSAYANARTWMTGSTEPGVRVRCGACTNRVRPPKFFRSCPECDRENRKKFGETYWRRLFQLPGVEVCPIHEVFLESSDIRFDALPNRHKYFSAEKARLATKAYSMNPKEPSHTILVDLARRIEWLLQKERLNPGLENLHQRYQSVLAERNFATRAGSIRMADLREEIIKFYGTKLLELLQCELPNGERDGWLGHLLRKTSTAVAPLRHLLLLATLNIDLEQFFAATTSEHYPQAVAAPIGPWPCLNPVCEHRSKLTINKAEPEPPDSHGNIYLLICCSLCGFTYRLRDDEEISARASHIVDYGSQWKNLLLEQWNDTSFTLREMAKSLGVDPKTVKHRAIDLGLTFPRPGKRLVTTRGVYVPKERKQAERIEENRRAWTELRAKHSTLGIKALRKLAPALYARLYRSDLEWLKAHQPARLPPPVTNVHVNWAQRDEELAGQVATAAHHIKNAPGRPRQVTTTAIGRVLGKQSLFETALARLPLTRDVINHLIESGVDFAVRRVHAAAARLRRTQGSFQRWQLVRAAGLHYHLEHDPRVKQALDYEVRPSASVVFFSDAEHVPKSLLQPSTRLPCERPIAIVHGNIP